MTARREERVRDRIIVRWKENSLWVLSKMNTSFLHLKS